MKPPNPFFSIIVPAYSRPQELFDCLQAVCRLEYPRSRFEAVVVDDGSKVPVEAVVDQFRGVLDLAFIPQANRGCASSRNTGAFHAKGDFVAFLDHDCEPAPDWLDALAARLSKAPSCIVGGLIRNRLTENIFSTASQLIIDYLYSYYNADPDRSGFFCATNIAMSRDLFIKTGGFRESFHYAGEDREFSSRAARSGARLIFAPEAVVYHAHELDLRAFIRQHRNYGRGSYHYYRLRSSEPQRLEPLSFYRNFIFFPFSTPGARRKTLLCVLMALAQACSTVGFLIDGPSGAPVTHAVVERRRGG